MELNFNIHSLIVGVGPNQCGKTFFFKQILIPGLTNKLQQTNITPNIKYISSEDIRRWLLSDNDHEYNKRHPNMMEVSESAFKIINLKIIESMNTFYKSQFIIVDTSGLNKNFRSEMIHHAIKNNYTIYFILFDYKERKTYYKYSSNKLETNKSIILFNKMY